jgi:predicted dehydrogenase
MRIGFVGCGGFSGGNHIPNAAANPNLDIVGFCDLNEDILKNLEDQYKPKYTTTDMRKLISDPSIEMIICGTKPNFRFPIMKLAVENAKHLFVEKPICYAENEIEPMLSLINNSNIKFMVGFNRPYSPLMRDLKPIYKTNKKGSATIIYRIIGESILWPEHHYDAVVNRGESTIIHETTHIFDLLNWVTDLHPTRIHTVGEKNMDNVITISYPENVTAVIIAGDNSTAGFPKERIEINTNNGVILGDNFVELTAMGFEGDDFHFHKTYDYTIAGEKRNTSATELAEKMWEWRKSVTDDEKQSGYYYERMPKVDKGIAYELEAFRKMIENGLPSQTDVNAGAIAQRMAYAAINSCTTGEPVDIPPA